MFSRFSRFPLRRCLHTTSGASRPTRSLGRSAKVAFGASVVAASYITWQLTQAKNQISMDSPRTVTSSPERFTPVKSPQPKEVPSEPISTAEPDVFVPDAPSVSDTGSDSESDTATAEADGETPSGEASASGGAYNPETGEINWDCPCLGGMAHGPCGPEFREAFSCFVFSEAEPKGINCVEKFQNMQNCFRAHPDVYADEIMNDDEEDVSPETAPSSDVPPSESIEETFGGPSAAETSKPDSTPVAASS